MWQILQQAQKKIDNGFPVTLVTLVEAFGSTYRKPGAKMIVDDNGDYKGTISGGCLENDVAIHARQALEEDRNKMISYDLNEDLIFGLGLGCGGAISLIVEHDIDDWLPLLLANQKSDNVLVKCVNLTNDYAEPSTIYVFQEGKITWENNDNFSEEIKQKIISLCYETVEKKISFNEDMVKNGERVRIYFDYIKPPQSLVIFGGGDDALPVASLARQLNFEVTVIDYKPVNLESHRFVGCLKVLWDSRQKPFLNLTKDSVIIIMSHNVERDAIALEFFYRQKVKYIGLLGPKKRLLKFEIFFKTITLEEVEKDNRIFAPIGLDIGSETPEEISVSIMSEIIAVRNKAGGLNLRGKKTSIHHSAIDE